MCTDPSPSRVAPEWRPGETLPRHRRFPPSPSPSSPPPGGAVRQSLAGAGGDFFVLSRMGVRRGPPSSGQGAALSLGPQWQRLASALQRHDSRRGGGIPTSGGGTGGAVYRGKS
jgi:hypothetical protein